jgi:hypothetical protein
MGGEIRWKKKNNWSSVKCCWVCIIVKESKKDRARITELECKGSIKNNKERQVEKR